MRVLTCARRGLGVATRGHARRSLPRACRTACSGVDKSYTPGDEVPEQWAAAALFDALSGQQDRHSANWLWSHKAGAIHIATELFRQDRNARPLSVVLLG
jgi:hypothetical protein